MVTAMTALLKCSGVNEDDMRTEEFVKSFRKNGGDDETRTRDLCRDSTKYQMSLLIVPLLYPDLAGLLNFSDPISE